MKKIAILFTSFLMFGANIYWNNSSKILSELQLANIEALASSEIGASNTGLREEKNAMVADIKWCVVPLIPNHALTQIVINFFFYTPILT